MSHTEFGAGAGEAARPIAHAIVGEDFADRAPDDADSIGRFHGNATTDPHWPVVHLHWRVPYSQLGFFRRCLAQVAGAVDVASACRLPLIVLLGN